MSFSVGSLVRARGREWIVLPESDTAGEMLVLRPLGGGDDEATGIYLPLETVESASFPLPDPSRDYGSHRSCRLLRDALRLGFRSAAGPFRCLGRIAVEPRPYQFVPLLMALKQDPVRILIADDVGVGKSVEATLIARELLDRGEITRTAVLCPPHLAEQWQRTLAGQFHIDAVLVLPSTAARLERNLGPGESPFDRYPHVVVSMDYIKSERRRQTFINTCPELVIVDEAHTCVSAGYGRGGQQRHALLSELAADAGRHLVLVTATPHSGNDANFKALLALLEPSLGDLPDDLAGEANRPKREHLARYLVQRRRADLRAFLNEDTPFPERKIAEVSYTLHPDYLQFFNELLEYCRGRVLDRSLDRHRQRIRWWSALALLRAVASSPAAAAATMRVRAAAADTDTADEADAVGLATVLDLDEHSTEGLDVVPGSLSDPAGVKSEEKRKLEAFAAQAEELARGKDRKLDDAMKIVMRLLKEGHHPILFCRFIATAEYVAEALRQKLGKKTEVAAVTGALPPEEREARIRSLAECSRRVLVCTDCLSEGINLQEGFDTVMHYDLCWNPTRHEQREGRVDRYGQPRPEVRTLTFHGQNNPVDGLVLKVLLRKHQVIHKRLGIVVPVPSDTNQAVAQAMMNGLLYQKGEGLQGILDFGELSSSRGELDVAWENAADREKKSRTLYAQSTIKVDEVSAEVAAARKALGDASTVERFVQDALTALGAAVRVQDGVLRADLAGMRTSIRDVLQLEDPLVATFGPKRCQGGLQLGRTHPVVERLASHVLERALESPGQSKALDPTPKVAAPASRCGVIRTRAVRTRTFVIVLRLRFHIETLGPDGTARPLLAEELATLAFEGTPEHPKWLTDDEVEVLAAATPDENVVPSLASKALEDILSRFGRLDDALERIVLERGEELLRSHRRVRTAAGLRIRSLRVEPHRPPDVLGTFMFQPVPKGGGPR